ncbi:MAG: RecB-like helicase [Campylobacteraceae bacterium]
MSFERNLALLASAGSGKTFALSTRYIALLLLSAKPSNIVALTFTKKAANEMKSRVFETLQNLENKEAELKELCKLLETNKEEILEKRDAVLKNFLEANIKISTIDSFFGLILRKFSLHLGLLPDFTNTERSSEKRLKRAFIKNAKRKDAYNSLVHFANFGKKSLNDFFAFFELLYEKDSEIENFSYERILYPNESEVMLLVNTIKDFLVSQNASETALNQFSVEDVNELAKKGFWKYESLNYRTFSKVFAPKLDELYLGLKDKLYNFYNQKEKYWLGELFYLFGLYKSARQSEAKKRDELSFTDVTNAVYSLLYNHIDSEFLYFRLDANIEHLLIDEFQDTNIVQYKILKPIIEEITAGVGVKEFKSFFYVGDIKQSIYRFRGGAKALFSNVAKIFNVKVDSLIYNFRSSFEVVNFVNSTFSNIIKNYENQTPTKKDGFVEVFTCKEILDDLSLKVKELLEAKIDPNDIAVLCVTNKDAQLIKTKLKEDFLNLHVNTESTVKLINSPNVEIVLEFMKYLYFEDELYGRNFQVLIGESFETLPNVEGFSTFDKPLNILNKCIKKFNLNANDIDIVKFIEVSSNFDDLESLLFGLDELGEKSANKESLGIKVLTIHKSKGLEFPHVIVLDKIQRTNARGDLLMFDYDDIELKQIFISMISREFVDNAYKKAKEKEELLSIEDTQNQLYVSFTRA